MTEPDEEDYAVFETWDVRCKTVIKRGLRMTVATIVHGIGVGVIGICMAQLIKQVQILGFGVADDKGGFFEIADNASEWRRFASVSFAGVFSAAAWYWLRGADPAFVPVEECMKGAKMPPWVTVTNGAIQDIAVALGGSFGREAAPREIAAMYGGVLADALHVTEDQRRILVACGTGAGLAAVYSVPIAGTLYTIEHILNWDLSFGALMPAVVTSCLATFVSSFVVEIHGLYHMHRYSADWPSRSILIWATVIGPVAGIAAALFTKLLVFARGFRPSGRFPMTFQEASEGDEARILWSVDEGRKERLRVTVSRKTSDGLFVRFEGDPSEEYLTVEQFESAKPLGRRNWHILVFMPLAFIVLAALSMKAPSLLGNGRALAEVSIHRKDHGRSVGKLVLMLLCKIACTAAAIGSGVDGGTLTPSVALGATLGAIIGEGWQDTWEVHSPDKDQKAVISSVAFLAPAMRSPVTGLWLIVEFSAQGLYYDKEIRPLLHGDVGPLREAHFALGMFIPMSIAVTGATLIFNWLMKPPELPTPQPPPPVCMTEDVLAPLPPEPLIRECSVGGASDLDLGPEVCVWREEIYQRRSHGGFHPIEHEERISHHEASPEKGPPKFSRPSDVEDGGSSQTSMAPLLATRATSPLTDKGTQTSAPTCGSTCFVGPALLFGSSPRSRSRSRGSTSRDVRR